MGIVIMVMSLLIILAGWWAFATRKRPPVDTGRGKSGGGGDGDIPREYR